MSGKGRDERRTGRGGDKDKKIRADIDNEWLPQLAMTSPERGLV